MENIKQKLSDFVHSTTVIVIITLFLFTNNTVIPANALKVEPKTEVQLKEELLEKYRSTAYRASETLSDEDLKNLLQMVGFEGKSLRMAWAIAKKESNGRPMAYNGNRKTGDSSYGIFQINMLGQLGIQRREKFNLKSNTNLFDPVLNAEITYRMSNGGKDWTSWKGLTPEAKEFYLKFPTSTKKK